MFGFGCINAHSGTHQDRTRGFTLVDLQSAGLVDGVVTPRCVQPQGCADFKDFTYYPRDLKPKFYQLRASWTYMSKEERLHPAFVRPKRWFKKKEWKRTKQQKVFGLTTSAGTSLSLLVPKPWSTVKFAAMIKNHIHPFLQKSFPNRRSWTILLDGEPLLHGDAAKAQMVACGIQVLPKWPKYSPDLNPQENVWARAEDEHREKELRSDTFDTWKKRVMRAVRTYKGASKLIPSMVDRVQECIEREGAMIRR